MTGKNIGKLDVQAGQKQVRKDGKTNTGENEEDFLGYEETKLDDGVVISVNRMDDTSYRAKYTINNDLEQVLTNFLDSYKQSHSMIIGLRIL